ncbi:hypothetical protein ACJX0J_013419, partial [Zea mays]
MQRKFNGTIIEIQGYILVKHVDSRFKETIMHKPSGAKISIDQSSLFKCYLSYHIFQAFLLES